MPKLKAVVSSADDIPQGFADYYAEDATRGEWVLQIDGVNTHPTVRGLSSALEKQKTSNTKLKERLDAFGDLTTEELEELREKAEAKPPAGGGGNDEEAIKARVKEALDAQDAKFAKERTKFEREKTEWQGEKTKLTGHLHTLHVENELTSALGKLDIPEQLRAGARTRLKSFGPKVIEEDGKYRGVFEADAQGVPGEHSIGDFVKAWAESEEGQAYQLPTGRAGSGAPADGSRKGGGGGNNAKQVRVTDGIGVVDPEKVVKGDQRVLVS